ncbi:MAG: MBL fold metallo-hydrolase [Candidatus Nanoarchaeia archaeon]|nr:MBL fold metallo-hydrolase [Candidatus Nanoarchaeia archaeon]MDD5740826.1 MBL fold metallo-hydrolase [Candidatus Nanoarchaeia archaeon]
MISKISPNVFQLYFDTFGSTAYVLKLNKNIMIDTSTEDNRKELIEDLKQLGLKPENIEFVILTHNHWDHTGNLNIFKNAKIITADNLSDLPSDIKPIKTPGHTQDSLCFLYKDILFSGDTIFHEGGRGRTDLKGGNEKQIQESIKKLKTLKYNILCPGHIN